MERTCWLWLVMASILPGGLEAAGLEGSYWWRSTVSPGMEELYHFRSDGRIHRGVTSGDPALTDLGRLERQSPELVGRYRLEGDHLVIEWADSKTPVRVAMKRLADGSLEMAGGVATKLAPLPEDTRLAGSYTANDQVRAFSASSPSIVRSSTLRFSPDGSWVQGESTAVTTGPRPSIGSTSSARSEAGGLFRLEGNQLILGRTDGDLSRHFIVPLAEPGDPPGSPRRLVVDGKVYQRDP